MKVAMKIHITGSRNGVRWPQAGGEVDLPSTEAVELIQQGLAEPVVSRKQAEKATAPAPESRQVRTSKSAPKTTHGQPKKSKS